MAQLISSLKTSLPSENIGEVLYDTYGFTYYNTLRVILMERKNDFLLKMPFDIFAISGPANILNDLYFEKDIWNRYYKLVYDIEMTTPCIYHILFLRLKETEIEKNFGDLNKWNISAMTFTSEQINKLLNFKNNKDFIYLARDYITKMQYITITQSKQMKKEFWDNHDAHFRRTLNYLS